MFDTTTLLAFTLASFIIAIVPGANVSVIIATSLSRGTAAGLAVVVGTQIGILSMIFAVALGFEALISVMGWAFDWIKIIGALYLIYLGFNMLRTNGRLEKNEVSKQSLSKLALRGFLVMWANPKILLFFGAFIPQFIPAGEPAFAPIMFLGLIFLAIASITDSLYAILVGSAGSLLTKTRIKLTSRIAGIILMLGGIWLALQKKA